MYEETDNRFLCESHFSHDIILVVLWVLVDFYDSQLL